MIAQAVLDTGPLIHLEEIERLDILKVIDQKLVTGKIVEELGENRAENLDIEIRQLKGPAKDRSKYMVERESLDLGEATAIALCKQEDIELIFTDDLDARNTAKRYGVEPHGTLALVTRAFREGLIDQEEALKTVDRLYNDSSLYLTKDLVEWTNKKIQKHDD